MIVYYPVEKSKWQNEMKDQKNWMDYNRFGNGKQSLGLNYIMKLMTKGKGEPKEDFTLYRDDWKFPAKENADYDLTDVNVLKPIIFSHGYLS